MSESEASSGKMMRRISVSLREDQYLGLEEVAEDLGINLSDAAREAINAYLLETHWKSSIGQTAKELIRKGLTNQEVLAKIREKFPHGATSPESIAWYRSKMRREGEEIPTDREAKARRATD